MVKMCLDLRAISPVSASRVSLHPSDSVSGHSRYIYQNAQNSTLSIVLISIWLNSNLHKNRCFIRSINCQLTRNSPDYRLTQLINLTSKHPQITHNPYNNNIFNTNIILFTQFQNKFRLEISGCYRDHSLVLWFGFDLLPIVLNHILLSSTNPIIWFLLMLVSCSFI